MRPLRTRHLHVLARRVRRATKQLNLSGESVAVLDGMRSPRAAYASTLTPTHPRHTASNTMRTGTFHPVRCRTFRRTRVALGYYNLREQMGVCARTRFGEQINKSRNNHTGKYIHIIRASCESGWGPGSCSRRSAIPSACTILPNGLPTPNAPTAAGFFVFVFVVAGGDGGEGG